MPRGPRLSKVSASDEVDSITLGSRIRQLRLAKQMSLREFARRLGLSHVFLSDLETGSRFPSEEVMERIALELGVRFEDLQVLDPRLQSDELSKHSQKDISLALVFKRVTQRLLSGKIKSSDLENLIHAVDSRR